MSDVGGASRDGEEEPQVPTEEEPQDIHVVREQLVQREPSPLITVVGQEHEPETDPEEDPKEEEEEDEFPLNSIDAEMYDELYDRNVELRDTVQELNERTIIQQITIEQRDREVVTLHTRLGNVEWDLAHEKGQIEEKSEEIEKLKNELKESSARLTIAEEAWVKESRRADLEEEDCRTNKAKLGKTYSTLQNAMDEAQDLVMRYPIQFEGLPSYMLDRRTMFCIIKEERCKAVQRLNMQ